MSDKQLQDRVFKLFQEWIDLNFHKKYNLVNTFGAPDWKARHDEAIREFSIKWDQTLNVLGIRRIEWHLKVPPRKGLIRFGDPFIHGPNKRRDLEMTRDQIEKILVLGLP